jgi:hypothetical protein
MRNAIDDHIAVLNREHCPPVSLPNAEYALFAD